MFIAISQDPFTDAHVDTWVCFSSENGHHCHHALVLAKGSNGPCLVDCAMVAELFYGLNPSPGTNMKTSKIISHPLLAKEHCLENYSLQHQLAIHAEWLSCAKAHLLLLIWILLITNLHQYLRLLISVLD